MREFEYENRWKELLTPEIVGYLTKIHEFKGEQSLLFETKADTLMQLMGNARMQSIEASNKIEGICLSEERLRALVKDTTRPKTRDERETAGYRDVRNTICESFDYIPPKPSVILQLHRDLYKYEGADVGGKYKNLDDLMEEEDANGKIYTNINHIPACETSKAMDELCLKFEEAFVTEHIDSLILIPMFILDFLCIHPFNGGNGRMSRLLTLLMLYRSGYCVGKYISIEKLIESTRIEYFECIQRSSKNWHENNNNYEPFVKYMLEIIYAAYRDFSSKVNLSSTKRMTKPDRVREMIRIGLKPITKAEIVAKCPDISQITIQRALAELVETKEVIKIGGGRYTKYIWNNEKDGK